MTAAIILILLSVADIATMHRFLQLGIREANPLMRWAFDKLGFVPTSAIKLALTAVLAWGGRDHFWAMAAMCTLQGAIVVWNIYQIWRSK